MNILLLGGGGREHALAWKIAQSPACKRLYIAPGNGGTRACGTNVPMPVSDFAAISAFVLEKKHQHRACRPRRPPRTRDT